MSKKRNELPTLEASTVVTIEKNETATPVETCTTEIRPVCKFISFSLPVQSECPARSFQDEAVRVDCRKITRERMAKLKAIRRGMKTTDVRLKDGSEINTNSDVIYYILDQVQIPE